MLNKIMVVLDHWLKDFRPKKETSKSNDQSWQQYKINFYPSGRWSIHLLSDKLELGVISYGETRKDFVSACVELSSIIPNEEVETKGAKE